MKDVLIHIANVTENRKMSFTETSSDDEHCTQPSTIKRKHTATVDPTVNLSNRSDGGITTHDGKTSSIVPLIYSKSIHYNREGAVT